MNILLTNDDGIESKGIERLFFYLSKENNVFILAPKKNMSGVSHSLEMNRSLFIENRSELFGGAKNAQNVYSIDGSPADCVCTAVYSNLFCCKFDFVVSGCNQGANLGTDIIYSGTCAAARQASLLGLPSLALSLSSSKIFDFDPICKIVSQNILEFLKISENRAFFNINAFDLSELKTKKYLGFQFANLCKRKYNDTVKIMPSNDGAKNFYTQFLASYAEAFYEENSDFSIAKNGKIAVSLVKADFDLVEGCDDRKFKNFRGDFAL